MMKMNQKCFDSTCVHSSDLKKLNISCSHITIVARLWQPEAHIHALIPRVEMKVIYFIVLQNCFINYLDQVVLETDYAG